MQILTTNTTHSSKPTNNNQKSSINGTHSSKKTLGLSLSLSSLSSGFKAAILSDPIQDLKKGYFDLQVPDWYNSGEGDANVEERISTFLDKENVLPVNL